MKKVNKRIIIVFLMIVSFFLGGLYVIGDVYYSSRLTKKNSMLNEYYRSVVFSQYLEHTFDDCAPYVIENLFPCIRELSTEEKLFFYMKVLSLNRVKTSAGLGTSIANELGKDINKIGLRSYIQKFKKAKKYKNLTKEEKKNIDIIYGIVSLPNLKT